jgi:integrase
MGKHAPGRLGPLEVSRLKQAKVDKKIYHADGGGLYLQRSPGGGRSWVFRYKIDARTAEMGLGSAFTVSLAEARQKAEKRRKEVLAFREGETTYDPLAQRRQAQQRAKLDRVRAMTFRQCAEAFMAAKAREWKNPIHAQQWPQSLRDYVFPVFGDAPVQAVDTTLVMKAIEPLWQTKTETANRVRSRVEQILDYAKSRGYRDGENPARWRGHVEHMLPRRMKAQPVEHFAALPHVEMPALMAEVRRQEGPAARALEFLALTAVRAAEATRATWSEIDLAEKVWTIPAERMKADRAHTVPLSAPALAILQQMPRHGDLVFARNAVGEPLSPPAMRRVLADIGFAEKTTVHGLRATFRSWAAERTAFTHEVIEMALAHAVGDAVVKAYQRSDLLQKRRALAEQWAVYAAGPAPAGEVVAIGAAR